MWRVEAARPSLGRRLEAADTGGHDRGQCAKITTPTISRAIGAPLAFAPGVPRAAPSAAAGNQLVRLMKRASFRGFGGAWPVGGKASVPGLQDWGLKVLVQRFVPLPNRVEVIKSIKG